jgi:hypothetical protein
VRYKFFWERHCSHSQCNRPQVFYMYKSKNRIPHWRHHVYQQLNATLINHFLTILLSNSNLALALHSNPFYFNIYFTYSTYTFSKINRRLESRFMSGHDGQTDLSPRYTARKLRFCPPSHPRFLTVHISISQCNLVRAISMHDHFENGCMSYTRQSWDCIP